MKERRDTTSGGIILRGLSLVFDFRCSWGLSPICITVMSSIRAALSAAGVFALFGLARYTDGLLQIFLRQGTGEALASAMARNWRVPDAIGAVSNHLGFGLSLWMGLILLVAWSFGRPRREPAAWVTRCFTPLLLSVSFTALAMLSLTISPRFPYGVNLALTVAYEGVFAPVLSWSLVGLSLILGFVRSAGPLPRMYVSERSARRWRRTGGGAVVVLASLLFAWATPSWFWEEGQGQGNMFKYVRMAAALAHSGSLDIAKAEGARENATWAGFLSHLPRMAGNAAREGAELLKAFSSGLGEGDLYTGSVQASRANRSMFRSHKGGIYYINAPGPGALLLPAYLLDRTLNRAFDWSRQAAIIVFWNLIGALLVLEMMRLAHAVVGSWTPAGVAAMALAASPPLWLYTFQVYPELPAALGLVYGFRKLLIEKAPTWRGVLTASLSLAFLPWLHQKYSVAAAAIGLMAAVRLFENRASRSGRAMKLMLLFVPLFLSAFSILVYNHALTGSVLPDATFRAVERTSFEPQNMPRGLLGLLFDVENGLCVYAPVYLLTLVSLRWFGRHHSRLYTALLVVVVSYVTVIASFPYWPGAVSTVARYILSVAPFAVVFVALVVRRMHLDGVLAGAGAALLAAAFSMSVGFHQDIVQSYQPSLLLSRTLYSDPYQYLPSFLSEGLLGSGPAHYLKLGLILAGASLLIWQLGPRIERDSALVERDVRLFPRRAFFGAAGVIGFVVMAGAVLERAPGNPTKKTGPEYRVARPIGAGSDIELAVEGRFGFEREGVWVPGGESTRFLISSPRAVGRVRLQLTNIPRENRVRVGERGTPRLDIGLEPSGREVRLLSLQDPYVFRGPQGDRYIYAVTVGSRASFVPSREGESKDTRRLGCYVVVTE